MRPEELRALQAPLKTQYADDPQSAVHTLRAEAALGAETVSCTITTRRPTAEAGLHPATGGDGSQLCSADMLLEALVSCAGVTLLAVATAMGLPVRGGVVRAEGELDFRGTLAVSRDVPVGFRAIRLTFDLAADLDDRQRTKLLELTERYCVVFQTLRTPPTITLTA
jgi:uncharacterized OsmC-like protein